MISLPMLLWSIPLLLAVLLVLLKPKYKNLAPGPPKLPLIGNLHQLGTLPHYSLWELSKKYGPVMHLRFGQVPVVIISSSEAAKELFKANDLYSCSRPRLAGTGRLSYNFLDIAFTPYGDYWREMRKICAVELFSAKRVQSFRSIREEEVGSLIDSILKSSSSSSSPVDLSEKMLALTANTICREAFGKSFEAKGFSQERFQEVIHEGLAVLGSFSAADFFAGIGWIVDRLTGLHARREKTFLEFDEFYQKVIDDHIQKGKRSYGHEDIIDVLLELEKDQTAGIQLSQDHIKAILMNIFLGGVDTGAIVMVWAMAELVKNPRVMKKAQEEIRNLTGDKAKVSETDIEKLDYLKLIIKETMRLHPPGTLLIPREAISKFSIKGYDIQPKTRIQVNVWAIGRDPEIWENPNEFFPERFIKNPIDFRGFNYELLPFGSGRRGCPGVGMGMALVELALANLLYCFDWKLPFNMKESDLNMEEASGQTTYKKQPLLLLPIKYQSA
uniref:Cytochrome P450 n=1 Tax=Croton stellatopilosus TaxID=431156 RepID=A0A3G2CK33_9ROSI|nr:cytochrome P450 [Croton stellatopilosus]